MSCTNSHLALLIPFALLGVALVCFLLILKMTVAEGTINGLIFYANIVHVNQATFFPPGNFNILSVFIAWINLDFGIKTCFYDGLNAYAKAWLQSVFPFYVWTIVGVLILLSHYSVKIARLLGPNPVAVMATLFLL